DARGHGHAGNRQPQGILRGRRAARPRRVTQDALLTATAASPTRGAPGTPATPEYLPEVAELLFNEFVAVLRAHRPEIEPVLRGPPVDPAASPELVARALQAQGIWFQLLSIAEQNAAMRQRRQSEVDRGYDQLRGTFAQVVSAAAAQGVPAAELKSLVARLRVRPVITAHPTEAKRVTVLEKHRRIYRRLVDLEAPRWTPRERSPLIEGLRTDIELLWLTGELRLEKPTVAQERAWGLYFLTENLFDVVPELVDKLERGLRRAYLACMLRRLDATLTCAEQGTTTAEMAGYRTAHDLIADLRSLEPGLTAARAGGAAGLLVRPVRREVEAFRFSTFRLDVRENTTRLDAALSALWRARNPGDPPAPRSPPWRAWLQAQLARPLPPDQPL